MNEQNVGTVSQVIGPVLDVKFADGQLPNLLNALEVDNHGETIIAEVAQHIGDQHRPLHRDELDGRSGSRRKGSQYRWIDSRTGRRGDAGTHVQPARSAD